MKKPKRIPKRAEQLNGEWTTEPLEGSSGKEPFPPDTSDLQRRIKENPDAVAAEAKAKLNNMKKGYRRELHSILQISFGVARHYVHNYKSWKTFFEQPFFQDGKRKLKARKHHKDALRHTLNFIFDARSKHARNRTGKYAAGLDNYMKLGMPAHIVASEIEKDGGIERLYEARLERDAQKPKQGRNRLRTDEDYASLMDVINLEGGKLYAGKGTSNEELDGSGNGYLDDLINIGDDTDEENEAVMKRGADPEGRPTIEFEMMESIQSHFLDLKKGRRAVLEVKCLGITRDGWQRLRVKKVRWLKV